MRFGGIFLANLTHSHALGAGALFAPLKVPHSGGFSGQCSYPSYYPLIAIPTQKPEWYQAPCRFVSDGQSAVGMP